MSSQVLSGISVFPAGTVVKAYEGDSPVGTAAATETVAADGTPFGYSEAQANELVVTANALVDDVTAAVATVGALVVDVTALAATVTDTQADVAAVKAALDTLELTD